MLIVRGLYKNKEYTLEWKNGKLYGEKEIVEKALEENKKDHGMLGTPPTIAFDDYLICKITARALLIKYVFDEVLEEKNDIPPRRSGAIY